MTTADRVSVREGRSDDADALEAVHPAATVSADSPFQIPKSVQAKLKAGSGKKVGGADLESQTASEREGASAPEEASTLAFVGPEGVEAGKTKIRRLYSARDLCALPDPPGSDQLLGPLILRGQRIVLGAHSGEGKTTLGLQIVRTVLYGERFLDWDGAGGDVRALVVDAEQGLKTIKRRLREVGLDACERLDYLRVPDGLALDTDENDVAELERVLAGGDYALVFAGPLYKLHRGDSNDERGATDLMRRFDAWREEHGFALMTEAHLRKPMPKTALTMHDFFGSSAYLRGAEVVLGLRRVRAGYAQLHFFKDRDGDLPLGERWGLVFDRGEGFRRDPDEGKPSTEDLVRQLREADPAITQVKAAELIGVTDRTVRKYWDAQDDGRASLLEEGSSE